MCEEKDPCLLFIRQLFKVLLLGLQHLFLLSTLHRCLSHHHLLFRSRLVLLEVCFLLSLVRLEKIIHINKSQIIKQRTGIEEEVAWEAFVGALSTVLHEQDLLLVSADTVRGLIAHYGFDKDPIISAKIELHWKRKSGKAPKMRSTNELRQVKPINTVCCLIDVFIEMFILMEYSLFVLFNKFNSRYQMQSQTADFRTRKKSHVESGEFRSRDLTHRRRVSRHLHHYRLGVGLVRPHA